MLHRRLLALALSLLFVAAPITVAPAAFAASATQSGYDDTDGVTEEPQAEPDTDEGDAAPSNDSGTEDTPTTAQAAPSPAPATSNLPFTGLEAGLIAAAGLGLAGTGFALRRATREQG